MNLPVLERQQTEMAARVVIPTGLRPDFPPPGAVTVSMDVQYTGDDAFVAMDLIRWGLEGFRVYVCKESVTEPYEPGFFAFREGPVLEAALRRLTSATGIHPELLIIDGHGRAHPRLLGVASWLGLKTGIPSIGVAKETLVRFEQLPGEHRGDHSLVTVAGEVVGYVLRSVAGVKPIFVSPGHLLSLDESREIVLALGGAYRVIEPIRRADHACRAFARGETHGVTVI